MGGTLSRSPRQKSVKKDKHDGSLDVKGDSKNSGKRVKSGKREQAAESVQGTKGMERRDSKNFWISHINMRKKSQDSLHSQTVNSQTAHSKSPRELSHKTKQHSDNKTKKQLEKVSGPTKNHALASQTSASSNFQRSEKEAFTANGSTVVGGENQDIQDSNSNVVPQSPGLLPGQASGSIDASTLITVNELYNYFWDGAIHSNIFDPSYLLLVDARSKSEFDRGHIILARSGATLYNDLASPLLGYGFNFGEDAVANRLSEYTHVIVYGNAVSDLRNGEQPEITLMRELMTFELVEPLCLDSGYDSFQQVLPFMCTTKELSIRRDHKEITVYPSLIIENQLYLGKGEQATNAKIISDLRLTHVINIGSEHPSPFTDRIQYLNIKLDDNPASDLKVYFCKACQFISDALSTSGCILVHCNLGVSRSSTIVIAYLMKSRHWTLKVAHDYVRDRRTCIRPNRGFLVQLSDWEQSILGKKSTDPDELWF